MDSVNTPVVGRRKTEAGQRLLHCGTRYPAWWGGRWERISSGRYWLNNLCYLGRNALVDYVTTAVLVQMKTGPTQLAQCYMIIHGLLCALMMCLTRCPLWEFVCSRSMASNMSTT